MINLRSLAKEGKNFNYNSKDKISLSNDLDKDYNSLRGGRVMNKSEIEDLLRERMDHVRLVSGKAIASYKVFWEIELHLDFITLCKEAIVVIDNPTYISSYDYLENRLQKLGIINNSGEEIKNTIDEAYNKLRNKYEISNIESVGMTAYFKYADLECSYSCLVCLDNRVYNIVEDLINNSF